MNLNYEEVGGEERWDRHGAFHKSFGGYDQHQGSCFSVFSTGEVRCNVSHPKPDIRRKYRCGIELLLTSDPELSVAYSYDAEFTRKIPGAWLNQGGGQYLLRDTDTGRCVSLAGYSDSSYDTKLPSHLKTAKAYTLGSGDQWVGGSKVAVSPPDKELRRKWDSVKEDAYTYANALVSLTVGEGQLVVGYRVVPHEKEVLDAVGQMYDDYQAGVGLLMELATSVDKYRYSGKVGLARTVLNSLSRREFNPSYRKVENVEAIYCK